MGKPEFRAEQEVRFAVVLYGGVSLAVYINGVVQEMLRMVRATAPEVPLSGRDRPERAWFATEDLSELEQVYRRAGQLRDDGSGPDREDKDAPIRRRFVVDILSGTSAGGINAVFLAKAIANQESMQPLRDLWIDQGAIEKLLNDAPSYKGLEGVKRQKPPHSLLNSARLYTVARDALRQMKHTALEPTDEFRPSYADEVDLAVTTTDLQGLRLPIKLADLVVYETRHRNVLRFAYSGMYATGEQRNDFGAENNELLAFAARCTSSFPFAFEAAVPAKSPFADDTDPAEAWKPFFPDYVAQKAKFAEYAFADGGVLDNKPFTYATEALRRRRADVPVRRKLIYVEPDPVGEPRAPDALPPPPEKPPDPVPDAVDTVIASMLLPRHETIREDIAAVVDRNRTIERIRELTGGLEDAILGDDDPLAPLRNVEDEAPDDEVFGALRCPDLSYRSYLELRYQGVIDELAAAIVRLGGGRDDSDEVLAVRYLVRAALRDDNSGHLRAFLWRHDVRFRLRRLAFVQDRVNDRIRWARGEGIEEYEALKHELNDALVHVRRSARVARRSEDPERAESPDSLVDKGEEKRLKALREAAAKARPEPERVLKILDNPRAAVPDEAFRTALDTILAETEAQLAPAFRHADDYVLEYIAAMDGLAAYHQRFESFDMVLLPLVYPDLEEVNPVEVVRIAPEDATSLVSEGNEPERRKLAGTALGHFGGFMDADWRRNDLLWGRLDGAERLLTTLVDNVAERKQLIAEAHYQIIWEELIKENGYRLTDVLASAVPRDDVASGELLANLSNGSDDDEQRTAKRAALRKVPPAALLAYFAASFNVPRDVDPQVALGVAGRAATITGAVLDEASKARSVKARPGFWMARVGRVAWGLAEVAVPAGRSPRLATLLFRYWAQVLILLAVILILAGLLGVETAQKVGWLVLAGTVGALAIVWIVGGLLSRRGERAERPDSPRWRRLMPWGILGLGIALILVGLASEPVLIAGWIVAAIGAAALILMWLLSSPDRRRLIVAVATIAVLALVLAGVEVGRHADDDVSTVVAQLPGSPDTQLEGVVRDGWDTFEDDIWAPLWPWDAGEDQALAGRAGNPVTMPGEDHVTVVVNVGTSDAQLADIRQEIKKLERSRDRGQNEFGRLLGNVLTAATPAAISALAEYLRTTEGLSVRAAEALVSALARGGLRLKLAGNITVKQRFAVDRPTLSLGGVRFGIGPTTTAPIGLGGLHLTMGPFVSSTTTTTTSRARRELVRLLADQNFVVDSAKLSPTGRARLQQVRLRLAPHLASVRHISIAGYTDFVGRRGYNHDLSLDRIHSVEAVLLRGLPIRSGVVQEHPYGESRILATTLSDPVREFDRRVDVVITWRSGAE